MAIKIGRSWLFLLFLIVAGIVSRWHYFQGVERRVVQTIACADVVKGCRAGAIEVQFSQSPHILQPFTVTIHHEDAREMAAVFAMQGMEMGLNRYRFKQVSPGKFSAEVILPVCVQGRSDWNMQIESTSLVSTLRYQLAFKANR